MCIILQDILRLLKSFFGTFINQIPTFYFGLRREHISATPSLGWALSAHFYIAYALQQIDREGQIIPLKSNLRSTVKCF